MARKRVDFMKLKQLLLLKEQGKSNRGCERELGIHRNTVNYYVHHFESSGLSYQKLLLMDEASLKELFPHQPNYDQQRYKSLSSYFTYFQKEFKKPGCTREVLWKEYLEKHPDGYRYSQFNKHYNRWLNKVKISGKLVHIAGDKMYVDYTGKKLSIVNKKTGEVEELEVFVAILPSSQYTYVEASRSQKKEDFIGSMNRALAFFEGVPKSIVTDNLRSAVSKSSKYEAVLNKSLRDLALHYQTTINPTRAYSPQDKALVEGAVKLVYQRIYYALSKMTFFNIADINAAIREKLVEYNNYEMSRIESSRKEQFIEIEKPFLGVLPANIYELKEYRKAKVQKMGFIYLSQDKNYYSVPYRYIGQQVEVQYNTDTVEVYYQSNRIALHKRSYRKGAYIKQNDHLSSSHKFYQDWSPDYFKNLAAPIGSHVQAYVSKLLDQGSYPEVAYKQCLGIIHLKKDYSERLNDACQMALDLPRYGYHIIKNILLNKMDIKNKDSQDEHHIKKHKNIRGSDFYY